MSSHGLDPVLRIRVDGMPQTKGSWRPMRLPSGRMKLLPDNDLETEWSARIGWMAKTAPEMRGKKPDGVRRYEVRLNFTLEPPHGKKNKRDLDKLVRSCLDALSGLVYADDEQVDSIVCSKGISGPGDTPGVEIWAFAYDFSPAR